MSAINKSNITPAISGIVSGQRAIKVGDKVYPVGVGGNYLPTANKLDIDLSFITATSEDILEGKIGTNSSGNPITGTLKINNSGLFDLAKITQYSPATEAFSGLSQIVVSGLGDAYDIANGTYAVTTETEKETDPFNRIYRHTSGNWYIWGEYDPEYEEGCFYIGVAPNSGDLCCYTSEELADGEYYFENWDTGDAFDVSLDVTKTDYPESPMVLKGVMATGYDANGWSFATSETDFIGFEYTPKAQHIYASTQNKLVGNPVGFDVWGTGVGLVMYAPLSKDCLTWTGQKFENYSGIEFVSEQGIKGAFFPNDHFLRSQDVTGFPEGASDRTVSCFAKLESNSGDRFGLISFGDGDSQDRLFSMEIREHKLAISGAHSGSNESHSNTSFDPSVWHHFSIVYRDGTVYFYVNGVQDGTFEYEYDTALKNLWIGTIDGDGGKSPKYIASARIYNRALSADEIKRLSEEFDV